MSRGGDMSKIFLNGCGEIPDGGSYYVLLDRAVSTVYYDIVYYMSDFNKVFLITAPSSETLKQAFEAFDNKQLMWLDTEGETFEEYLDGCEVIIDFKNKMSYDELIKKHPEVLL